MRHLVVLVGLLILAAGCNRPANQVATKQPETKVERPKPQRKEPSLVAKNSAEQQIVEEEVRVESSRISKHLRPDSTPAFVIDPVTGEKAATLLVELRESGCIQDSCSQFTLQLFADYTFRYVGIANVDLLGEFTGKADFNPMIKIGPLTSKVGFFKMDEAYPRGAKIDGVNTISTTKIYVDHRGRRNIVTTASEAPPGFQELEKEILSWVDRVIWTPIE